MRKGEETVSDLRPLSPEQAQPNSLSSRYGKGAQPLHTDGAHLERTPNFILMVSPQPNSTTTQLWKPTGWESLDPGDIFDHGVFLVQDGRDGFFATARTSDGWRFDPGCMTPCDARARRVVELVAAGSKHAREYVWDTADQVLLIDNRAVLHARSEVAAGDDGRRVHRIAFTKGQ